VEGAFRFLRRLWAFAQNFQALIQNHAADHLSVLKNSVKTEVKNEIKTDTTGATDATDQTDTTDTTDSADLAKHLRREMHTLLKQADYDMQRKQYNTVVSAAMKMLNALEESAKEVAQPGHAAKTQAAETVTAPAATTTATAPVLTNTTGLEAAIAEGTSILLRVLYPVVPHLGWVLWKDLGFSKYHGDMLNAPWPMVDESALSRDTIDLVLQINGKVRGSVLVAASADQAAIEAAALATEAYARFSEGRAAKKIIVVAGRLVNIVV
jgi:leucyl-tRNA synthetase